MMQTTIQYILDTINGSLTNVPDTFVQASNRFVETWFLTNSRTAEKLRNPMFSTDRKQGLIEARLDDLDDNTQFQAQLEATIKALNHDKTNTRTLNDIKQDLQKQILELRQEGYISNSNVVVVRGGNNTTIDSPSDFIIVGDSSIGRTHYVRNIDSYLNKRKDQMSLSDLKPILHQLIRQGELDHVLKLLLEAFDSKNDNYDSVILLSARFMSSQREERMGIINHSQSRIELNQINTALLELINDIP